MTKKDNKTYRKADTCANCALSDVMVFGREDRNLALVCKKYERKVSRLNICDDHQKTDEWI